jgi:hypothetical protein
MEPNVAREVANNALAGLSQEASGVLQLDDDGICRLVFDSGTNIYVVLDAASSDLVVWAPAGILPPEGQAEILRTLMQANLFWGGTHGGTLSLAPDGETVILARRVPLHGLETDELSWAIEQTLADAASFNQGLAFSSLLSDAPVTAPSFDPRDMAGMIRG